MGHGPVDTLEILEVGELDQDPAALGPDVDADASIEVLGQELLELEDARRPQSR